MANKKVSQLTSKPSVLVTDLFPIADPSTGQLYKTTISDLGTAIGSGVSSVNGLVGAVVLDTDDIQELVSPTNKWFTDTRARAALSASSPLTYNSGTGLFSIPAATSSQNGYLTSTDWTTFNGKQAALSGTGFVKISGTTISYDNSTYLTTSDAANTYLSRAGGEMTGQIILKVASSSTDYTKGLKFPDNPGTGTGDISGLRLYVDSAENQVLELYVGNDTGALGSVDKINFATGVGGTPNNDCVTINGNIIWNAGNLTPQSQLNGTGFVKASGTTITYDNSTYLTTSSAASTYLALSGGTLTGALSGTSASFSLAGTSNSTNAGFFTINDGTTTLGSSFVTVHRNANDGNGRFSVSRWQVQNTSGLNQSAFIGAQAVTGASNYSPNLILGVSNGASSYTTYLTIASTGAATFSSSVTADLMGVGISSLSSWGSTFKVTEYPYGIYVGGTTGGGTILGNNNYYNGTSYLYKNSDYATQYTMSGGNHTFRVAPSGTAGNAITWTSAMTILSGGNVGIGTATPGTRLDIVENNSNTYGIISVRGNNRGGALELYNGSTVTAAIYSLTTNDLLFYNGTGYAERVRITSGGTLQVNNNSTNGVVGTNFQAYAVSSNSYFRLGNNTSNSLDIQLTRSDSATMFSVNGHSGASYFASLGTGLVYSNSGILTSTNPSDSRLKSNIKTITYGLNDILKLRPVSYNWKDDKVNQGIQFGFIAQEVQEVMPDSVKEFGEETKFLGLEKDAIYATLINAIKELKSELDTLKNK